MRSEVYFLPPRTSVTDSVGISTLPIFSCSPKACTRDSRAFWLFSEIAIHLVDAFLNHVIDDEEVHAKDENRDYNHCRGGLDFFPRRSGDLAHLGAHIVIKRLRPIRPGLQPVSKILAGGCD